MNIYSSSITSAKGSYNSRNISDIPQLVSKRSSTKVGSFTNASQCTAYDPEKEPIKAFLRIRPKPKNHTAVTESYIEIHDNIQVTLTPPENSNAYRTRHRAPETYRFTHIFPDTIDQRTFFNETSIDLVKDILTGKNALLFAYGVTNSGKTYSVMGKEEEDAGLLPRTLATIFQNIHDQKSETKIKPVMHSMVQAYELSTDENRHILNSCNIQENLLLTQDVGERFEIDPKYEYGIWVSFIEVYNEQLFDLLDISARTTKKRNQLHLKYEQRSGCKYVSDANMVKVKTMEEADAIMRLGLQNRQVFSTLMNQTSSRSHSIFTIHVVRCPIDDNNFVIEDPNYATISKLSIVDLAGSERYRNTNSTGQRLKEAGNINKSLMVLGQCMEVLRVNQAKIEMGKTPTIVPFRHSKLTELFKSTFEGDGKVVLIVNINPFDTGFDENSHVMKFAAVAKDVTTWSQTQPKLDLQNVSTNAKRLRNELKDYDFSASLNNTDDEEDDEESLEHRLITHVDDICEKWKEAESRVKSIEVEVRDQISRKMDVELKKMEEMYLLALQRENEMMDCRINDRRSKEENSYNRDEEKEILDKLHERQQMVLNEIGQLVQKLQGNDTKEKNLLDRIAELERENQKEREYSRSLREELQKHVETSGDKTPISISSQMDDHHSEDEDEDDKMKENNDPQNNDSFNTFLDLRKQLRRSIFKKEELCKDADLIMNQVEQFDGVTFNMAKETKMGKLLKLIAQEEFEKDPYQIRNRAVRLFKKYAQLPTSTTVAKTSIELQIEDHLPRSAFLSMTLNDANVNMIGSTDIETVKAENIKLKHMIKSLSAGRKRLKEAYEKIKIAKSSIPAGLSSSEDISMMEHDCTKDEEATQNGAPPSVGTDGSLVFGSSNANVSTRQGVIIDDYESDISEMLKQTRRQKRRRKLRQR